MPKFAFFTKNVVAPKLFLPIMVLTSLQQQLVSVPKVAVVPTQTRKRDRLW